MNNNKNGYIFPTENLLLYNIPLYQRLAQGKWATRAVIYLFQFLSNFHVYVYSIWVKMERREQGFDMYISNITLFWFPAWLVSGVRERS